MRMNPYLHFNGQCDAAFKFYEQCLGGKIIAKMTYRETPMADKTPPEFLDKVVHARLMVGDHILMGSDAPPDHYRPMEGFSVTLNIDNPADADRTFQALAKNGTVRMEIQETFWARRFGMLVDQFGTPWMINCEKAR
jgi:PhnB protein